MASSALTKTYAKMGFVDFVEARQGVLLKRREGLPREQWTHDPILSSAKFCNIDRRDDAVTAEFLDAIRSHAHSWGLAEKILLALALRFSGSRRGEASHLANLIDSGLEIKDHKKTTPLRAAFEADEVRCGTGTYQLSLNRRQVATVIEKTAAAVVSRVQADGPFTDVLEASDFVAEAMTVGKRPQFSANETAKDFAYVDGLMQPASHHRCKLGPGAKKGLSLVRATEGEALAIAGSTEEESVEALRAALRLIPSLAFVETIDVEQALCEYSKYEAYCTGGISVGKRFEPRAEP